MIIILRNGNVTEDAINKECGKYLCPFKLSANVQFKGCNGAKCFALSVKHENMGAEDTQAYIRCSMVNEK